MTMAEICGKISHTGQNLSERMEDLLTSDIFSACKYLRPQTLLIPFLCRAKGLKNEPLGRFFEEQVKNAQYSFWPGLERCEPDVLITIEFFSGYFFIVLVEAKYFSSKSSLALNEEELEIAVTPNDQLAREYLDLLNSHNVFHVPKSKVSGRALLYTTAHRSIPIDSLKESLIEMRKFVSREDEINLYWTSWFELYPIISQIKDTLDWERPILVDLKLLLERKRLVHFRGFNLNIIKSVLEESVYKRKIKEEPAKYRFALAPETINTPPIFYFSKPRIREYRWAVPIKQLICKIYEGGAL